MFLEKHIKKVVARILIPALIPFSLCFGAYAQEAEWIGRWRCDTVIHAGETYNATDLNWEVIFNFSENGAAEFSFNGEAETVSWRMVNGVPIVTDDEGDYPLARSGDAFEITDGETLMRFVREPGAARTIQALAAELLPGAPRSYKGSPMGSAKRLEGRNLLVTIFVNIEGYEWAWEDIEAIRGKYVLAKNFLEAEAGKYGKTLDLVYDFEVDPDLIYKANATAEQFAAFEDMNLSGGNVSAGDVSSFVRLLGTIKLLNDFVEDVVPYQKLVDKYETDSIVYCFQVKKWAPANYEFFYNPDILPDSSYHEKFIMFDMAQWGAEALPHELLHAFGAVDLYLESPVNGVSGALVDYARTHYPNDIMGNWDSARVQDSIPYEIGPVTAYCLGWLDDIPELGQFPDLKRHTPAAFYDHQRHVDPSLIAAGAFPASGGSARVDGVTEFAFTPDHSDLWILSSSDCGANKVWIEIYDGGKVSLGRSRMGGGNTGEGGRNASILRWLEAGETYYIRASFVDAGVGDNAKGSYTLTVENPEPLPGNGGVGTMKNGAEKHYYFTPAESGAWAFVSMDRGGAEIYYTLYAADEDGDTGTRGKFTNKIGQAVQPKRENTDDSITVYLDAGQTFLLALSSMDGWGDYTVNISKK